MKQKQQKNNSLFLCQETTAFQPGAYGFFKCIFYFRFFFTHDLCSNLVVLVLYLVDLFVKSLDTDQRLI